MKFFIRYADINDFKTLGMIHSESWKMAYKGIVPDLLLENMSIERSGQKFYDTLTEKSEDYALIYFENEIAGFIGFGKSRDRDLNNSYGEIRGIYLLPEFWNKGIGTKFINWTIEEFKKRNYNKISLWVFEKNTNARKFYEKVGFTHDGTKIELILGKPLNELRYVKDIS